MKKKQKSIPFLETTSISEPQNEKELAQLPERLSGAILSRLHMHADATDEDFQQIISNVIGEESGHLQLTLQQKREMAQQIFNRMRRLDILQPMMDDSDITEIMVNGPSRIFFERNGRLFSSSLAFHDKDELELMITNFFSRANRPLNETYPIGDLRLPDGSRANAVLPPVAPDGPIFTIRKFTGVRPDMEAMISQDVITREAAHYLEKAVKEKKTIFLCGGTGSGKTTFLNMLSSFIPSEERVITIEDSAELSLQGLPNLVRLEARLPGPDGKGEVQIDHLIRAALRMRPSGRTATRGNQKILTSTERSLCSPLSPNPKGRTTRQRERSCFLAPSGLHTDRFLVCSCCASGTFYLHSNRADGKLHRKDFPILFLKSTTNLLRLLPSLSVVLLCPIPLYLAQEK